MHSLTLVASLASLAPAFAQYTMTWDPENLPEHTEDDQSGTNRCGTGNNQTSLCQNVWVNSLEDFCVWGPPEPNSLIGAIEQHAVSYCSHPGRGGRLFPPGTLTSAHFLETDEYIQVTGHGDFTKINIADGDAGGEMDAHGPDGLGNPHGGLVITNVFDGSESGQQIHEWTNFQSFDQFCIRACKPGPNAKRNCQHIYDVLGCVWNIPGQYGEGFTSCKGDMVIPMGEYPQPDGSTSTFHQGENPTPAAHPPAASSECTTYTSASIYSTALVASTPTATATGSGTRTQTGAQSTSTSAEPSSAKRFSLTGLELICFIPLFLVGLTIA